MRWVYDDGGRADAGYRGEAGDCCVRAIAIASELPYKEVYAALNATARYERPRNGRSRSHARIGVKTPTIHRYLVNQLGWTWTPTMFIGSGCTVHVRADELPKTGRHVLNLSRHLTALVDGAIFDTYDPSRDGMRCVYGYWSAP